MSRLDTIVVSRMISILALSVFAGCADDPAMPEGEHRLQVSAVAPGGSQLVTGAASDFSIRLDEVLLVLGEVKLERQVSMEPSTSWINARSFYR